MSMSSQPVFLIEVFHSLERVEAKEKSTGEREFFKPVEFSPFILSRVGLQSSIPRIQ